MSFFLFEYSKSIFTPRAIFARRHVLNWFHIIFLWIFLNSLVVSPLAYRYSQLQAYEMERIVENGLSAINDQTVVALQQGVIENGRYQGRALKVETNDSLVIVLPSEAEQALIANSGKYVLVLHENNWSFRYPTGQTIAFPIQQSTQDLTQLQTVEDVKDFLNREWFSYHKFAVVAILTFVSVAMIYFGSFMVIFIGAATVRLVKKSRLFSIETYKECVNLLLNCFGIPTLLATVATFFVHTPAFITNVQVLGTVLMLVLVFYKTHFRDED